MTNSNLKPFTGIDDKRRMNGRRKGSKNISSITRDILDSDIDIKLPLNEDIKQAIANNSPSSFSKAMVLAMTIKAINGDVRAASWVSEQYDKSPDPEGFFEKTTLNFMVVPNRPRDNEDS